MIKEHALANDLRIVILEHYNINDLFTDEEVIDYVRENLDPEDVFPT